MLGFARDIGLFTARLGALPDRRGGDAQRGANAPMRRRAAPCWDQANFVWLGVAQLVS